MPTFKLIVLGSIYIDRDITQLDGTYVAVPANDYANPPTPALFDSPRQGTIITCANNFDTVTPDQIATNNDICRTKLTVNGSFVANQIFFLRNFGSLTDDQPGELFNYSPEMWLAPGDGSATSGTYKSIVGLPPVL
jgi:hypothetical protein